MINILFFGDVVGQIGRKALIKILPELKRKYRVDLVLANAENIAHGCGVTVNTLKELLENGVDYFTSGNHFWKREMDIEAIINQNFPIIRPANYPEDLFLGQGYSLIELSKKKAKVLLINLMGRVFTKVEKFGVSCPFKKADEILNQFLDVKIKIIDFHAEATSEKVALAHYLDGRVSLIVGTHTHVQTADEVILPKGTAYITDLGMVGAKDSVIGVKKDLIIQRYLLNKANEPLRLEIPKKGLAIVNGVFVRIEKKTGKAKKIERIFKEVLI
jgi:metallophosphoesterase (TIGR00282 family)